MMVVGPLTDNTDGAVGAEGDNAEGVAGGELSIPALALPQRTTTN